MTTFESRLSSVGIDSTHLRVMDLTYLSELSVKVTNGIVLDLHKLTESCHHCTYYSLKEWLIVLLRDKWPVDNPPNFKSICQSIVWLNNR